MVKKYTKNQLITELIRCVVQSDWNCCGNSFDYDVWNYVELNQKEVKEILKNG